MAQNLSTGNAEEVIDLSVIKMDSSESLFIPASTKTSSELTVTLPKIGTVKLGSSFPLDNSISRAGKRIADVLISSIVIIGLLSWLLPILALLIKLDSKGPVFFLQKRAGRKNKLFTCIKLRSMYVNSQADLVAAVKNDERITKLGHFLRRHYLDELPQFFNVLMGDMSVVGPRPHMISDNMKYEEMIGFYDFRHRVKPGITGLAQSLGFSGPITTKQTAENRVRLDVYYIRHWSPKLDVVILVRTFRKAIRS